MEKHRGRHRLVAGATDTFRGRARAGRATSQIPVLIDIAQIPELRERRVDGKRVRFGAATPIQRFLDDAALARAMPCMPRCAVWFADDQIRESATIGGNIVNASPAADGTPPLIAHEAEVELAALRGGKIVRRRMKLCDFVRGPEQDRARGGRNARRASNATRCRAMAAVSRKSAIAARW